MKNRKFTVGITVFSIALSVALLLGVERVRTESRTSFTNTISGIDMIVGARSGQVQLLLYSVFRIGNATNNISWQSYQKIKNSPSIEWTIPISLGDSHRGYRVMGTTTDYFIQYRYGRKQQLAFRDGVAFDDLFDAVLGAEVAQKLGYKVGDEIVIAHGAGAISFVEHADKPFRVNGILEKTGTPVDKTVHVSLEGIEAIHLGWESGAPSGAKISAEMARKLKLQPKNITAFMVKLQNPISIFSMQRSINQFKQEPLTAILPGVALQELWSIIGLAEKSLLTVSVFVVVVGLLGMLTSLLTGLNERRREMAILRSVGARPMHIFSLVVGEALCISGLGVICGSFLLYVVLFLAQPVLAAQLGLYIEIGFFTGYELLLLTCVLVAGFLAGVIPGWKIYHYSLADGMSIKT